MPPDSMHDLMEGRKLKQNLNVFVLKNENVIKVDYWKKVLLSFFILKCYPFPVCGCLDSIQIVNLIANYDSLGYWPPYLKNHFFIVLLRFIK